MKKMTMGTWVKYEKEPRNWDSKDSSYTRLCTDLQNTNTGWSLEVLSNYIYGELIPNHGTPASDVYIYYELDANGFKTPKLCLSVHACENGKTFVEVYGTRRNNPLVQNKTTLEPEADYAEIVLEKLEQLNAQDWQIEEYTKKVTEYEALKKIDRYGVQTADDILTIYRNLQRTDTSLAEKLVKGRSVQMDYDGLSLEQKKAFVIIMNVSDETLSRLAALTDPQKNLLVVKELEVLQHTVEATQLQCLRFALPEYTKSKKMLLEILSLFKGKYYWGIDFIPHELQADIDVLHALIKEEPYYLHSILGQIASRKRDNKNTFLIELLRDKDYMLSLLDMYYRCVITNAQYQKESYIPSNVLWEFTPNMITGLETKILQGPFRTQEEERMKSKALSSIKLERRKMKEDRRPNCFND